MAVKLKTDFKIHKATGIAPHNEYVPFGYSCTQQLVPERHACFFWLYTLNG